MGERGDATEGELVYPKLPVPKQNDAPKVKGFKSGGGRGKQTLKFAGAAIGVAAIGLVAGYLVAPDKKAELAKTQKDLASAQTAAKVEKDRADGVAKQLDVAMKDKADLEKKVSELSTKAGELEKKAAEQNMVAEKKLKAALDTDSGSVSSEGDEIRLKLVDKVLFAVGDDKLTPKGMKVLDKVGKALAELEDKQVWVQGHTDDQPIVNTPPKKDAKKKKGECEPAVQFASNWELSSARALQVVHYLQDKVKIDPTRLAALAFSEYRPVSKSNKAANRRIEIVLYPHKAVIERSKKK
ncbi:MAG: OmpA family protein [Kofleriaceae bacterium]|nr:OmpA family protein [Kofleriaceae bacterium]